MDLMVLALNVPKRDLEHEPNGTGHSYQQQADTQQRPVWRQGTQKPWDDGSISTTAQ